MTKFTILLAFLGLATFICGESIFKLPDFTRRLPYRPMAQGCRSRGIRYKEGDNVPTDESCLNCTCIKAVIVCYLRVCPTAFPPPSGCFPARVPGECCPALMCGGMNLSTAGYDPNSSPDLRPTFQPSTGETYPELISITDYESDSSPIKIVLDSGAGSSFTNLFNKKPQKPDDTTEPLLSKPTMAPTTEGTSFGENIYFSSTQPSWTEGITTFLSTHAPDESPVYITSTENPITEDDISLINDIPGGCKVNGTVYGDGSAMLSGSLCEYCFCIRGKTTCMRPKCHMTIPGCVAQYDTSSCCPSSYNCSERQSMLEANRSLSDTLTTETTSPKTTQHLGNSDCVVNDKVYHQGELVHDHQKSCQNCYCSDAEVVCEKISCSSPIDGCQPIIPEGRCCPVSYRCGE